MLHTILILASMLAAVLPMLGFLALLWWMDRYDREPIWLVGLTFLWGAVGAAGLSLTGNTTLHLVLAWLLGDDTAALVTPVLVAPLTEEPTKALILLLVARSRQFDNVTDGFVYGAAAGLGFGMTENFMYFSTASSAVAGDVLAGLATWVGTVLARTFYSALMHAAATSCVGAAIGWARFRRPWAWALALPIGFACAVGMHALWNGLLTAAAAGQGDFLVALDFLLFPAEFFVIFVLFQGCLLGERRLIRRELRAEAAEAGTLPADHADAIASWRRRGGSRFVGPQVDREAYIRAATTLAFRRHQARQLGADRGAAHRADLDRLRLELRGILAAADGG